jgi:hypothetical protein
MDLYGYQTLKVEIPVSIIAEHQTARVTTRSSLKFVKQLFPKYSLLLQRRNSSRLSTPTSQ